MLFVARKQSMKAVVVILVILLAHIRVVEDNFVGEGVDVEAADVEVLVGDNYYNTEVVVDNLD